MIKVNLLPKELQDKGKSSDWIIIGYGFIGIVFMFAIISYSLKLQSYKKNTSKKEIWAQQLSIIKSKVAKVEELDAQKNSLNAKKNTVVQLFQGRLLYPKFMESFFQTLPKDIWISDLNVSEDSNKNIKVIATSNSTSTDAIADWLQLLESKPNQFSSPVLSAIEAKTDGNVKKSIYGFTMTFSIIHQQEQYTSGI